MTISKYFSSNDDGSKSNDTSSSIDIIRNIKEIHARISINTLYNFKGTERSSVDIQKVIRHCTLFLRNRFGNFLNFIPIRNYHLVIAFSNACRTRLKEGTNNL
jgi:hypothetical protein